MHWLDHLVSTHTQSHRGSASVRSKPVSQSTSPATGLASLPLPPTLFAACLYFSSVQFSLDWCSKLDQPIMKTLVFLVVLVVHQTMADPNSQNLVSSAANEFANKLYKEVSKEPGNVLVCPLSLHIVLTLVHQGAQDKTASELETTLGLSGTSVQSRDGYKVLLTGLQSDVLKIATKLYPASDFQLNKDFVTTAQQYFFSDVEGVDFSNSAMAANTINQWVEQNTNNKIHEIISPDSVDQQTRLVIVNAVHFNANWKKPFDSSYDSYFRVTPEQKVETKMMSQTDYFSYKNDVALDAKVLRMEYANGGYSMLFVLPNKEDGLPALEAKLAQTDIQNLTNGLYETKVEVTIPKFKLEKTIELNDILKQMGITEVFSSRANLKGITSGENIYVSKVLQKTFINVHENGTEAAAATGIHIELLSANVDTEEFLARRPFHFYLITEKTRKLTLFDGRFVKPQEQQEVGDYKIHFNEESQGIGSSSNQNPDENIEGISSFQSYLQNSNYNPQNTQSQRIGGMNPRPTGPTPLPTNQQTRYGASLPTNQQTGYGAALPTNQQPYNQRQLYNQIYRQHQRQQYPDQRQL